MAQSPITCLTEGQFYQGPWDTVYYHAIDSIGVPSYQWMGITLDTPFPYDPAKSLLLFAGQCGGVGGDGLQVKQNKLPPLRRVWSFGGCPFIANNRSDSAIVNFVIDVTLVGVNNGHDKMPIAYNLSQNYPNPFNPATRISYDLPIAGNVKLAVYDVLGIEVATLVKGFITAGYHSADFDASNLASGIYIYRITAGTFRDAKKMMLVK